MGQVLHAKIELLINKTSRKIVSLQKPNNKWITPRVTPHVCHDSLPTKSWQTCGITRGVVLFFFFFFFKKLFPYQMAGLKGLPILRNCSYQYSSSLQWISFWFALSRALTMVSSVGRNVCKKFHSAILAAIKFTISPNFIVMCVQNYYQFTCIWVKNYCYLTLSCETYPSYKRRNISL